MTPECLNRRPPRVIVCEQMSGKVGVRKQRIQNGHSLKLNGIVGCDWYSNGWPHGSLKFE